MNTARLRKVGGSVMLAVPRSILDSMGLAADRMVNLELVGGSLVVNAARPKYRLDELLDRSEPAAPFTEEDRVFLDSPPVGREEI